MGDDIWLVIRWWSVLFLIGAAAYPLTKRLFANWFDQGYFFSKAVGMAGVTYIVYILGVFHILPFTGFTVSLAIAAIFLFGIGLGFVSQQIKMSHAHGSFQITFDNLPKLEVNWKLIVWEEIFFFAALLFWSWVKAHEPTIRDLEKFMDFGFMKSILTSVYFPAPDMWYVGLPINYYYFGHTVVAVLTKISGLDLTITYNLMLTSIFAFCLTMSFAIGRQLIGKTVGGLLTAFLVTLGGNMQTLYAFTKGYTGEDVKPFWQLLWTWSEFPSKVREGLNTYWYPNATRFIPNSIHEFPAYSFVVSDVHGHVLSIPFVLLAIALLFTMFAIGHVGERQAIGRFGLHFDAKKWRLHLVIFGMLTALLLMTNALDGPIYGVLMAILLVLAASKHEGFSLSWLKEKVMLVGGVGVVAAITASPFLMHFKSFVSGLAINCPPAAWANRKMGIFLFEEVEKCQKSEFWMWLILWGFFLYCGLWLIKKITIVTRLSHPTSWWKRFGVRFHSLAQESVLMVFFFFSLLLIIFPEFFYFKDIYPQHFRSNTMFKLGYQAFIMFSIIAGYTIVKQLSAKKVLFFVLLVPQLFLVSIYPIFAVRSYFNSLRDYQGLDGLSWLRTSKPDDVAAIEWMNNTIPKGEWRMPTIGNELLPKLRRLPFGFNQPIIVEADGDSYTEYERFSAFTGFPTVVGWAVHEWLWRGSYDIVAPLREDVRLIYESEDVEETRRILNKYQVDYVIVGSLEREKFTVLQDWKFSQLGINVFEQGQTAIYKVR